MTIISYAQNHEDVLLDRVFPRGRPGFYIDVGANEPLNYSVTKHFYDLGWHGINVEPSSHPFKLLAAARERDINLNVALSDSSGELTFFEFAENLSGISTFSELNASRHREAGVDAVERTVPTMTLAELCEQHVASTIDFLSVDVEGHEQQVLAGGDWSRWRPRVVLVEATEPTTMDAARDTPRLLVPTHERWEHILLDTGYLFAAFDGLNRYYVRREDADLAPALAVPVNIADGYIPYEYDQLRQQQYTDWVANHTLRLEFHGLAGELRLLRAQYEKLERALTATRGRYESIRDEVAAARSRADEVLGQVGDARARLEQVGDMGLSVARRLTAASNRYPAAAKSLKKALRAGLQLKRSVSKGPGPQ